MRCPYCKTEQSYCVDSRQYNAVRFRRYRCKVCNRDYRTEEKVIREETEGKEDANRNGR